VGRKLSIPLTASLRSRRVEEVRKRLGGRATSGAGVGDVVRVRREAAADLVGVVIFVAGEELDVMTGESTVRRTQRSHVDPAASPREDERPEWLASLAADAKVFATLEEMQEVRYQGKTGELEEGKLVEKCRYGGIVLAADGSLMGVGFRRLWPGGAASEAS
jgi:predicted metalloprotease